MSRHDQFDYEEKQTFFGRFGFVIGILVVAAIGITLVSKMFTKHQGPAPRKIQEMVMVKPLAPPPPPPPPPPPQIQPKEQMMEQTPVDAQEAKPEQPQNATPAIGTNITGNGPADGFGLGRNGNGMLGGGGNGGRAGGSRFGWYANQLIKSFTEALSQNPKTRTASFNIKVRVWSDVAGRITRAKLAESTGDPGLDDAIQNEVLKGVQLKEPPPEGMPMPIVMRLQARRPN